MMDRPPDADAPAITADRMPERVQDREPDTDADRVSGRESAIGRDSDRVAARTEYRALADAVYQVVARQRWEAAKPEFQAEWAEHKRQHPAPPDASPVIDEPTRRRVEAGCKKIRETEENTATPVLHRIEAADPDRRLVGFEHRCKGEERIMEKVAAALQEQPDLTPEAALSSVKDAIRYTFEYPEDRYTDGVNADVDRLQGEGLEPIELKNSWAAEEYKGINSRWRLPEDDQLVEVQFHTRISFEAKQLTHEAYERIRNPTTADAEIRELRQFQRDVCAMVPTPPRAAEVPEILRRS